jgi:DNA invertase Pin-like site-specific DNA recombinase
MTVQIAVRAGLYARVSTADQRPETQLHHLRRYATARGLEPCEFVDQGVSGVKDHRPSLDRLIKAARARQIDVVAVTKLDRLARSTHHLVTLGRELATLGVDLVVLDQNIDTTTPSGRLLFHVLAAIAEFERDLIRERVKAGLERARARGARLGRPTAVISESRLRALRLEGLSIGEIARRVGFSRSTVRRRLRTPATLETVTSVARAEEIKSGAS